MVTAIPSNDQYLNNSLIINKIRDVTSRYNHQPEGWRRENHDGHQPGRVLALAEQRVFLVDIDPQSNLTSGVGLRGQRAGRDDLRGAHQRRPVDPDA